jgi:hypothetical protein
MSSGCVAKCAVALAGRNRQVNLWETYIFFAKDMPRTRTEGFLRPISAPASRREIDHKRTVKDDGVVHRRAPCVASGNSSF